MVNEEALHRLKNVEGHIRGIERMVENESYCIDIIRQIQAVQSAIHKINILILENHLNSCVITAIRGEDPGEREKVLKELSNVFDTAIKS